MKQNRLSNWLTYILVIVSYTAHAQVNWQSKGPLYEDPFIRVEIEYALNGDPCAVGSPASQFRYKITQLKSHGDYYINWRFDYFDCGHQLKTRANNLHISKSTSMGYVTPDDNQFAAFKMVNYINEVRKSPTLPEVTAYEPRSTVSIEPKVITGNLVTRGEATALALSGGYLAGNTVWKWYEGGCDGTLIGTGPSITVSPGQTTTYAVRAEGASATVCVLATVAVLNASVAATAIEGLSKACEGEKNIRLAVIGGRLANGARWVWYQGECGGTPIGTGNSINVSPATTTAYYVRAEGPDGNTVCQMHQLTVTEKSKTADGIDGAEHSAYGEPFTLSVRGGYLAPDAKWIWYTVAADHKQIVGNGANYTVAMALTTQTYFVQAVGACYSSDFVAKKVVVEKQPAPVPSAPTALIEVSSNPPTFFINGGVVANDPNNLNGIKNYVATIGGGKNIGWFLRAKINTDPSKADYETAGTQITNYNIPGYYQYNGKTVNKRAAYTGGIYLGGTNLAVYIGVGYGTRELLYGIDQYTYSSPSYLASTWVKNTAYSYTGAEVEGGLIIKAGYFNIMGGASTIQGKYTDYNLGFGFNF